MDKFLREMAGLLGTSPIVTTGPAGPVYSGTLSAAYAERFIAAMRLRAFAAFQWVRLVGEPDEDGMSTCAPLAGGDPVQVKIETVPLKGHVSVKSDVIDTANLAGFAQALSGKIAECCAMDLLRLAWGGDVDLPVAEEDRINRRLRSTDGWPKRAKLGRVVDGGGTSSLRDVLERARAMAVLPGDAVAFVSYPAVVAQVEPEGVREVLGAAFPVAAVPDFTAWDEGLVTSPGNLVLCVSDTVRMGLRIRATGPGAWQLAIDVELRVAVEIDEPDATVTLVGLPFASAESMAPPDASSN